MLRLVVHIAADLPQFIQRRELSAYEQRLARTGYAYGVDLRRAAWLAESIIGDPLTRTVDRRWTRLVQGLEEDALLPPRKAPPLRLLEELAHLIQMLRAPLPTVRLLRPDLQEPWPMVTALGTTKGAIHWLVVDAPRVMALPAEVRTFVLASALGHLQCDHGPVFAAHLMAHRGARVGTVKVVLRSWAKVIAFSADRAGLVAVRSLEVALRALEQVAATDEIAWLPRPPALAHRRAALEDFDRSQLMVRRRMLSDPDGGGWNLAPPGREDEVDSLTHRIRNAFGRVGRVVARAESDDVAADEREHAQGRETEAAEAQATEAKATDAKAKADDDEAAATEREARAEPPPPPRRPPPDPEQVARLEQALRDAWSLARCDARLTRRLRLL